MVSMFVVLVVYNSGSREGMNVKYAGCVDRFY